MNAGKVRFGIIGAGMISNFHAEAIKAVDDAELTAVFDLDHKRAADFAAKHGVDGLRRSRRLSGQGADRRGDDRDADRPARRRRHSRPRAPASTCCAKSRSTSRRTSRRRSSTPAARRRHPGAGVPVSLRRRRDDDEARHRGRALRPHPVRQRPHQVVAQPGVLRLRRLARHLRARRRRLPDEPVDPHDRPDAAFRRPAGPGVRLHGDAHAYRHRGRGQRLRGGPLHERRHGRHRIEHLVRARPAVAHRGLRRARHGGDRGRYIVEWRFADSEPGDAAILDGIKGKSLGDGASDPKAISIEGHRLQIADLCRAILSSQRRQSTPPRRKSRSN